MADWPYNTKQWQTLRSRILVRDLYRCQWPDCGAILRPGRKHPRSAVVDHKTPHRGDPKLAFDPENLWALCKAHHDSAKQQEERRGYKTLVGEDGWPIDGRHPANAGPQKRYGYSIPHGVEPSGIPVMLVCGPPASGKSTYVRRHAQPKDVVIDFDQIRQKVGGTKWSQDPTIKRKAFAYRDRILRTLCERRSGKAWLIVTATDPKELDQWRKALGNVTVITLDTPAETCIERIHADPERKAEAYLMVEAVKRWHRERQQDTIGTSCQPMSTS